MILVNNEVYIESHLDKIFNQLPSSVGWQFVYVNISTHIIVMIPLSWLKRQKLIMLEGRCHNIQTYRGINKTNNYKYSKIQCWWGVKQDRDFVAVLCRPNQRPKVQDCRMIWKILFLGPGHKRGCHSILFVGYYQALIGKVMSRATANTLDCETTRI